MDQQKEFISAFRDWVKNESQVLGVALVGSYARGSAREDSDVDLVIISDTPESLLETDRWIERFGKVSRMQLEDYGLVQSRRVFYNNGVEVEFAITTAEWLNTDPIDNGTRQVLSAGHRVLDDKAGLFSTFLRQDLTSQIKSEFPSFSFAEVKLVNDGVDHAVLILDSAWVFRFPRTAQYRASFKRELALLKELNKVSPVPVPRYEYVSAVEDFGGYQTIEGEELRVGAFQSFPRETQERIAIQVASFLSVLHSLPTKILHPTQNDMLWDADQSQRHADRYVTARRRFIAANVPSRLAQAIDHFYERYRKIKCSEPRIIHDDLTDDHIFVSASGAVGIIDFGDSVVGDPAHDFAYFWSYGDWVTTAMYECYALHTDQQLVSRSYWHFVRYRIDCLHSDLRDKRDGRARAIATELESRLKKLP